MLSTKTMNVTYRIAQIIKARWVDWFMLLKIRLRSGSADKRMASTKFFLLSWVLMFLLSSGQVWGQAVTETFTAGGTFTVPLGVTLITVECGVAKEEEEKEPLV